MNHCSNRKKGLIIYPGAIGDCLLTLPLAHCIKSLCHLDSVDYLGTREYLEFYPARTCIEMVRSIETISLHRLFEDSKTFALEDRDRLPLAFAGYEQVVCLIGSDHPHFEKNLLYTLHSSHCAELTMIPAKPSPDYDGHISDYYINFFKQDNQLEGEPPMPERYVTPLPTDYQVGEDLIEQAGLTPDRDLVMIQPGSGSLEKCWDLRNFIELAARLKENEIQCLFLLGPAEQERLTQEDLAPLREKFAVLENLTLTHILQLLTLSDAFVGNDSGIGHLSGMLGKKTLSLFGPGNSRRYHPLGPAIKVLQPLENSFTTADSQAVQAVLAALLEML